MLGVPEEQLCNHKECQPTRGTEDKSKLSANTHYVQIITIKIQVYQQAREHIDRASTERAFYRDTLRAAYTTADGVFCPPLVASPCSLNLSTCVHYSFDYAQQVHYPSNPLQPGPIFFLTPRKCGLFGVCYEGIPRQINFLIDEATDMGKGANNVCSMLHYFFSHHGLGETNVHLNADNCCQNKNNTVIQVSLVIITCGMYFFQYLQKALNPTIL